MVSYLTYVGIEMPLGGLESMCFPNKKPSPKARIEPVVETCKKSLPVEPGDQDVEAATTTTTTVTTEIEKETEKGTEKETEQEAVKETVKERVLEQKRETEIEEETEAPVQSPSLSA